MGAPLSPRMTLAGARSAFVGAAAIAGVVALGGCGELLVDVDVPTRLVSVTASAAAFDGGGGKLRVSLVWRGTEKVAFLPSDDVAVTDTKAPIVFDIRRPPPESALHAPVLVPKEGTPMRFAVGGFVLYGDGDGDGALAFVPGRAEATNGDTIVGANPALVAVWLERSPSEAETTALADARGTVPLAGLNFLKIVAGGAEWARPSETIDLGTPQTTGWPERLCSYLFESPVPSAGPTLFDLDRTFPPPDAQGLVCAERGRSVSIQGCTPAGLCARATSCGVTVRRIGVTEGPPAGWPCAPE